MSVCRGSRISRAPHVLARPSGPHPARLTLELGQDWQTGGLPAAKPFSLLLLTARSCHPPRPLTPQPCSLAFKRFPRSSPFPAMEGNRFSEALSVLSLRPFLSFHFLPSHLPSLIQPQTDPLPHHDRYTTANFCIKSSRFLGFKHQ